MAIKHIILTASKILVCGLGFFAGMMLGGLLAGFMGLDVPALPPGADTATLMQFQLWGGLLFSTVLALIARHLAGGVLLRWLVLTFFSWTTFSLNTYLEAAIFTSYEAASAYTLIMQLGAALLCSGSVALLFAPIDHSKPVQAQFRAFAAQYSPLGWIWRLPAAVLAFPVIYVGFGLLAEPFIIGFYEQQLAGLALPGWADILPVAILRGLLFLLACLPLFVLWQGSHRRLFVTLGSALFVLVGCIYMLQSTWFPIPMRLVHSLEIAADSFLYSGVLTVLIYQRKPRLVENTSPRTVPHSSLVNRS
jgi:hypothetical protein